MSNRADYAKYAVDQHPRSKKQHECCDSHNGMRERDNSKNNCSDTPYHWDPPMTF